MKVTTIIATAALIFSSGAYAGLNGSSVSSTYYAYGGAYAFGTSATTFNASGTSENLLFDAFNITVTDNKVIYTFLQDTYFDYSDESYSANGISINSGNLLSFTGADPITGVTLSYDASLIENANFGFAFNSNQVGLNWENVTFKKGSTVTLTLVTTPVPEPENCALLLAGLGLIALRRRQA